MFGSGRRTVYHELIAFLICLVLTGNSGSGSTSKVCPGWGKSQNVTFQNGTEQETLLFNDGQITALKIVAMSVAGSGVVLNTFVIMAIIIDPLKTLRKGAWLTILNLAVADVISCISAFLIYGDSYFTSNYNSASASAFNATTSFFWSYGVSASFLILTFFTIQIFVITKFPLKSRFIFTEFKIVLSILAVWIISIPLGLSYLAYMCFNSETSFKIYAARIGVLQVALLVQVILNVHVTSEILKSGRSTGNDSCQNNKHRNIAKTVVILTAILLVTAFPYFLFKQIEFLARSGQIHSDKIGNWLVVVSYCYAPVALLNFTANPILYSLRLPDYRRTLLVILSKLRRNGGVSLKTTPNTSLKLTKVSSFQETMDSSRSPKKYKRCESLEERSFEPGTSEV
ncbi:succinate receptor 1-like [Dendronephthya gigantea]|uniref:succinate receptor 1-like n=1 Tax=Dendronephthya gigantea TaxID=151771 RepID=UPI00106B892D|nr:succinate receptor 1-like [Dendronephthya gigantea]XP_028408964.1 succinate receptor 1-like [Dendronephthya gigantea]